MRSHATRRATYEESFASLDKALGTIYIVGEITARLASQFRQHLRTLERIKRISTIQVEINSIGGDVEAGLLIIDSIELCKKPVTTRACGQAMSMAAVILVSGTHREALPNSVIMCHQATLSVAGRYEEIDLEVGYSKHLEDVCNEYLDRKTGQEAGYWAKRHGGRNLYLSAQEAVNERLIHSIVKKG